VYKVALPRKSQCFTKPIGLVTWFPQIKQPNRVILLAENRESNHDNQRFRRSRWRNATDAIVSPLNTWTNPVDDYRVNRSSGCLFTRTARRTASAVFAAHLTIATNSENGHDQRYRPPRWGDAMYSQWRYRQAICNEKLISTYRIPHRRVPRRRARNAALGQPVG